MNLDLSSISTAPDLFDINRPGLECLLQRLKARRQRIQPDLVKSLLTGWADSCSESMISAFMKLK